MPRDSPKATVRGDPPIFSNSIAPLKRVQWVPWFPLIFIEVQDLLKPIDFYEDIQWCAIENHQDPIYEVK